MSKGRVADAFDSLIVEIVADNGLTGWGEMAPLGNFYAPAFAAGARAGVAEIAPHLIGHDPQALGQIARLMDTVFKGHPYVKSALDMACWDLAARAADVPLVTFLGGRESETAELYKVVTHGPVEAMAKRATEIVAQGFGRLQVKVGGDGARRHRAGARGRRGGAEVDGDLLRRQCRLDAVPGAAIRRCDARRRLRVRAALHVDRREPCRAPRARQADGARRIRQLAGRHARRSTGKGVGRRADAEDLAARRHHQDPADPRRSRSSSAS